MLLKLLCYWSYLANEATEKNDVKSLIQLVYAAAFLKLHVSKMSVSSKNEISTGEKINDLSSFRYQQNITKRTIQDLH